MLRVLQNISKALRGSLSHSGNVVSGSHPNPQQQSDEAAACSEGAAPCVSVTCPEHTRLTNKSWPFPVDDPVVLSPFYHRLVPNEHGFNDRRYWESDRRQYSQFEGLGWGTAVVVAIQLCRALSTARFPSDVVNDRPDLGSRLLTAARLLPVFPPGPRTARNVLADSDGESSRSLFSASRESSSSEEDLSPSEGATTEDGLVRSKVRKESWSLPASTEDVVIPALEDVMSRLDGAHQKTHGMVENMMGTRCARMGNYAEAVEHFERGVGFGYSKAQFNLGLCYELGKGVPVDITKTAEFYRQAAHQGHPLALYNLAVYNYHGYGIPKDVTEGIELMERAADSGVTPAHSFLGSYYLQTESRDIYKAVCHLKPAVQAEDAESQYLLGLCYEQRWGVHKSLRKAAQLFYLSSEAGYPLASYTLGLYYEEGLGGILENREDAVKLYTKASDRGLALAAEKLRALSAPADRKTSESVEAARVPHRSRTSDDGQSHNFHVSSSVPNFTTRDSCKKSEPNGTHDVRRLSYLSLILPSLSRATGESYREALERRRDVVDDTESAVTFHLGADDENGAGRYEDSALNRTLLAV